MNILIHGYYGAGNAGDDAILHAMVDRIMSLRPRPKVTVSVRQTSLWPYRGQHPVKIIKGTDLNALHAAVAASRIVVIGGGGLLQDYHGFRPLNLFKNAPGSITYYAAPLLLAKMLGRPAMWYGVGVGPFRTQAGARTSAWLSAAADAVTVRDHASAVHLKRQGVGGVRLTADPAVSLKPAEWDAGRWRKRMKIPSKAKLVGVNLRRWPFQPALTQKAKRILARTVRHLAARYRAHFIVLPFNRSPKELQLARQFAKLAPAGRVHVLPYDQTPPELKGLCKGLDLMIAMRLHASILAAAAGTPAIGLVYDPKVSRFFHDLNLPNMCASVSQASAEALTAKAETLLAHPEKWRSRFLHGVRNLQKREEGNLHTLKALIQNSA